MLILLIKWIQLICIITSLNFSTIALLNMGSRLLDWYLHNKLMPLVMCMIRIQNIVE